MKNYFSILYFAILLLGFRAQSEEFNNNSEYQQCIKLAYDKPQMGLQRANSWKNFGGGIAADHCTAIALLGMGLQEKAAVNLEGVAMKLSNLTDLKRQILGQAAHIWLLEGNYGRAISIFTEALKLKPDDAKLLLDRAHVRGITKDYVGAILDLNFSIAIDPTEPLAFVLRATAQRHLNKISVARNDIAKALALNPNLVEGFLERGVLHRLTGNNNGARRDWVRTIELAPGSEAADIARRNLEILD